MRSSRPLSPLVLGIVLGFLPGATNAQTQSDPDTTVTLGAWHPRFAPRAPVLPLITVPEAPGPPAPPPYNEGSRALAFGEALLSNFIPWAFNEYVSQYKDITRISPTRWKENLSKGLLWDDNHFHVNMLMHPYAGSLSFNAGRTNGYNFEQSFLFSLFASVVWECCGESHQGSPGDLLSTTIGGAALGEMLYRWTNQLLNHRNATGNGWWEVPVGILNPTRTVTRWTLGRFSSPNPHYDPPRAWALFTETGWSPPGLSFFQQVGYTYGDLLSVTKSSDPFEHFEAVGEIDWEKAEGLSGRFQARGNLWSQRWGSTHGVCLLYEGSGTGPCIIKFLNIVPFLGFDYINNSAYEFGGQSAGLAAFFTFGRYPSGTYVVGTVDGHGLFGGVKSEFAYLAQAMHDERSERFREYDFTMGTGWGAALSGSFQCLRASGFYRRNKHWVVNGSNEKGSANHMTTLWGGTARCKLYRRFGLGVDYRRYGRESQFQKVPSTPIPLLGPESRSQTHSRFGIFVTFDVSRPMGIFVF